MTRLFDSYLMVDWSGASVPRLGKDSIWTCLLADGAPVLVNHPTRAAATEAIAVLLEAERRAGRRVLAGFDFALGYSAGVARSLGGRDWRDVWQYLAAAIVDEPDNRNNRIAVAAALNRTLSGEAFPFWGCPDRAACDTLVPRGRRPHGPGDVAERRLIDRRVPSAQSPFKLFGVGSVGSQTLLGIPRLEQLRRRLGACVWPFDCGLQAPDAPIVLAEVYPSLVLPDRLPGLPKDAGQVSAIARHFRDADRDGRLEAWFAGDPTLEAAEREIVLREESWVLGVTGLVRPPRALALGIGASSDADGEALIALVEDTLAAAGLERAEIAVIASIDSKADEPAVQALAAHLGLPTRFFPAARLAEEEARLTSPSEAVRRRIGVPGVAEAAALAAAGPQGRLLVGKTKGARTTCAFAVSRHRIDIEIS